MSQTAISVKNVSKRFLIGAAEEQATTFYDALSSVILSPLKRFRRLSQKASSSEEFWALKDINFEVSEGEVIGIIGHNGAGKSTLLKILSRITEPTEGRIEIRGRVASLLEVGTGFHPELTGRENIYLNGSILGMSRAEIDRNYDAIVEFAGIERFLDTPFKRYSSGMGVRLAFAVAAHLDPEILIIDEVLAVGDAQFQRKCLGKMSEVAGSGRTVLFVSHNMTAVENLCERVILLNRGTVSADGESKEVINQYLHGLNDSTDENNDVYTAEGLTAQLSINKNNAGLCQPGESIEFKLQLESETPMIDAHVGFGIDDNLGNRLTTLHTKFQANSHFQFENKAIFTARWENLNLAPGVYWITLSVSDQGNMKGLWERALSFEVLTSDFFGTGRMPKPTEHGHFLVPTQWSMLPN